MVLCGHRRLLACSHDVRAMCIRRNTSHSPRMTQVTSPYSKIKAKSVYQGAKGAGGLTGFGADSSRRHLISSRRTLGPLEHKKDDKLYLGQGGWVGWRGQGAARIRRRQTYKP